MDISDFSGVGDDDQQLEELLEELLEVAAGKLAETNPPKKRVSQLQGRDGYAEYEQIERTDLGSAIAAIDWLEDYDEAIRFAEHLNEKYDEEINEHYLYKLLLDAFGKEGGQLGTYQEDVDQIASNVIADIHGQGKAELRAPIEGLNIENDAVNVSDTIEIRNCQEGEVIGEDEIPVSTESIVGTNRIFDDSYLRVEFGEDDLLAKRPIQAIDLYTAVINLSVGGWTQAARMYITPLTYGMGEWKRPIPTGTESGFPVDVDKEHGPQIGASFSLLEPFFQLSSEQLEPPFSAIHNFRSPINIAISHYGRSVQMWAMPDSSVAFAILGLESLFIQHTTGTTPSKDVPRFAGLLIGNTVDEFDPLTIAEYVDEGYNLRNTWAHGSLSESEPNELPRILWSILRASIFVFAWLDTNTSLLDEGLPLSEALIDQPTRTTLEEELDRFDLSDYMPVHRP